MKETLETGNRRIKMISAEEIVKGSHALDVLKAEVKEVVSIIISQAYPSGIPPAGQRSLEFPCSEADTFWCVDHFPGRVDVLVGFVSSGEVIYCNDKTGYNKSDFRYKGERLEDILLTHKQLNVFVRGMLQNVPHLEAALQPMQDAAKYLAKRG